MKISKYQKNNILQLIFLVLVLLPVFIFVNPNISSASSDFSRCTVAQQTLNTSVRDRDLRTRVNRLQAYQYMHQKMDSFVQRLEKNNQLMAVDLRQQTDDLGNKISNFKENYEIYDKDRDEAVKVTDCKKNTAKFDKALKKARTSREVLHQNINEIDLLLSSQVQSSLSKLYSDLLVSSPTGVTNE